MGPFFLNDAPNTKTYQGGNYVLERVVGAGKTVITDEKENVVNVYYLIDLIGTNPQTPDTPDGIPDIYEARVTYVAVNGVVSFQTAVVTLGR